MKEFSRREFPAPDTDDIKRYARRVRELTGVAPDVDSNEVKSYAYKDEIIKVSYADVINNEQAVTRVLTPFPTPPEIGPMAEDRIYDSVVTPNDATITYDFNMVEIKPEGAPKAPTFAGNVDYHTELLLGLHTVHKGELTGLIKKLEALKPEDTMD